MFSKQESGVPHENKVENFPTNSRLLTFHSYFSDAGVKYENGNIGLILQTIAICSPFQADVEGWVANENKG